MPLVLVVDDSPTDRQMAGRFLQQEPDVVVRFAVDGNEALEQIRKEIPDAVVTDLQMPDCDGLELVDVLKQEFPRLPVILMTAQGSEEIATEALRKGAVSYVPKRAMAAQLRETVSRILVAAAEDRTQSRLMHSLVVARCVWKVQNDPDLLESLAAHLQEMLRCLPLGDEAERLRVGTAVKHALLNAHFHGNLEVPYDVDDLKSSSVASLIRERSATVPFAERSVDVEVQLSSPEACFTIRHEGSGFPAELCFPGIDDVCSTKHFSQGFMLMRSILDQVELLDEGRSVRLVKRAQRDANLLVVED